MCSIDCTKNLPKERHRRRRTSVCIRWCIPKRSPDRTFPTCRWWAYSSYFAEPRKDWCCRDFEEGVRWHAIFFCFNLGIFCVNAFALLLAVAVESLVPVNGISTESPVSANLVPNTKKKIKWQLIKDEIVIMFAFFIPRVLHTVFSNN